MKRELVGSIEVPSGRPSHIAEAIEELRFLLPVCQIEHTVNKDRTVTVNAYKVA